MLSSVFWSEHHISEQHNGAPLGTAVRDQLSPDTVRRTGSKRSRTEPETGPDRARPSRTAAMQRITTVRAGTKF